MIGDPLFCLPRLRQREKGIWNDATIGPWLRRYDLERIRVPTLLISAEDDLYGTFPSARDAAEHIPSARLWGIPPAVTFCWDTGRKPAPKWSGS